MTTADATPSEGAPRASVRIERIERTTWLTLDRPDQLNAFTLAGYGELQAGVEEAAADPDTRVIVLTGSGRAFSAGADRSLFDGSSTLQERLDADAAFRAMVLAIGECEKPVVAAVNGLAVGIGCTMLLPCDLVVLAESARLRLPFTQLGIVPEAGSSVLLPARAPGGDAAWALLSSEWIDAPTAVRMGVAWRVVPDDQLIAEVTEVATTLAKRDPQAVAATKRLMTAGRSDLVRAAMKREQAEMGALLNRKKGD